MKSIGSLDSYFSICFRTFLWLAEHGDPHRFDMNQAAREAQECSDLLSQSSYHEQRARKRDEQEQLIRQKQDEERQKLREKQLQEEKERQHQEEERRRLEREQRQKLFERAKNIVTAAESQPTTEKGHRGSGSSRKVRRFKNQNILKNKFVVLARQTRRSRRIYQRFDRFDHEYGKISTKTREKIR